METLIAGEVMVESGRNLGQKGGFLSCRECTDELRRSQEMLNGSTVSYMRTDSAGLSRGVKSW
jgi:hypothetical protein